MKLRTYYRTATPVAGEVSFNTVSLNGKLTCVSVKPATATTTWHLTITNPNGLLSYESEATETGEVNDVFLPRVLRGIHTVAITAASVNELFKIELEIDESEVLR